LFREEDRVLITGDAFVTTKQESLVAVATQRPELHGPPAYFTSDWQAAELAVQRLAGLLPNVVSTGHSVPMTGPRVAEQLDALAERLIDWARPVNGRYVHQPAVTDERGIVSLPPPVPHPATPMLFAGLAVAGTTWYLGTRRHKKRRIG
jgi:hypothetical protein